MQNSTHPKPFAALTWPYIVLGASAAWLVWYATAWGPWAYSDGVGYLVSARNLLAGIGLGLVKPSGAFEPLVSHPPLYPLLLAGLGSIGLDVVSAARLIDVFSFSALVFVSGWTIARIYPQSPAGPTASLLLLINPHVLLLFFSAMAEPLFLLAGFSGLLALALHIAEERSSPPVLAGVLIGLSILARYPGLSFWIAGASAMLLIGHRAHQRTRELLVFSGISLGPTALFWLWGTYVVTSTSPRMLSSELDILQSAQTFLASLGRILWTWKPIPPASVLELYAPEALLEFVPRIIAFSLLLGLAVWATVVILSWQRGSGRLIAPSPLSWIMALFVVSYVGFFFVGFAFTFPTPDVNQRTMSPLLVAGVILIASLLFGGENSEERLRWKRPAALLAVVSILVGYSLMTLDLITGFHRTGAGYTGRAWQSVPLEDATSRLGADRPLVSNHPEAVLLYTGRYPHDLNFYLRREEVGDDSCPADLYDLFHTKNAGLVLIGLSGDPSQPNIDPDVLGQGLAANCDLTAAGGWSQIRIYTSLKDG